MHVLKAGARRVTPVLVALLILSGVASAETLKVLHWNTHHGVGLDGVYNLQRYVSLIARSGAQVVSLNEVHRNDFWGNEDQPERYAALLRAATGKIWYHTFAQREGKANGEGNVLLSTFPIEAASALTLSYSRSVARAQIVVGGVRVNLFSTHLDADSAARRTTQMAELKRWASNFSQQHVMAGDFNAWPGAAEISNMTAFAYDAWAVAKAANVTTAYEGNLAGNTRNSRIDYIWYHKSSTQLVIKGAQVFDPRDSNGVMPSDHRPVMATFQVGGASGGDVRAMNAAGDFDGDWKSDLSVFRPGTGEWFVARSGGAASAGVQWGLKGDVPASADYDGDGKSDLAVFRPSSGNWYLRSSRDGAIRVFQWGLNGDVPIPGDYDGDGRSDAAVWRPGSGIWYFLYSATNNPGLLQWGLPGDVPVQGDYNGDGIADASVWRPSNGTWYVRYGSTGQIVVTQWGLPGDVPVPGDYDGDSRTDWAVYRPSNGVWYIRSSSSGAISTVQWGLQHDIPVPADYDGDGKTDAAVIRPSTWIWYLRHSSTGAFRAVQWGLDGDIPALNARR